MTDEEFTNTLGMSVQGIFIQPPIINHFFYVPKSYSYSPRPTLLILQYEESESLPYPSSYTLHEEVLPHTLSAPPIHRIRVYEE